MVSATATSSPPGSLPSSPSLSPPEDGAPMSPSMTRRAQRAREREEQRRLRLPPGVSAKQRQTSDGSPTPPRRPSPTRSPGSAAISDATPVRGGDASFATDFTKRDSVANINRQVRQNPTGPTAAAASPNREFDVRVFTEEPKIRVIGGRSEEAWPTRYVEYDVELQYKNVTWQVEIPKSTIYGLWFFVKSKMHGLYSRGATNGSLHSQGSASAAAAAYTAWNFPPMRKLFLANAEKSVSPEMVALVQQYLDAVVKIPALLHTSYVVEMFQVSNSTFDDEEGYTSVREGWLRVRMWLKGNQDNVRINRGAMTCDNECFNCMCVVKRVNFKSKIWGWVALKHSCIAVYPSIQDTRASEVFLFDQKFLIERGIQSAGSNTALLVSNSTFVMQLEAKTKQSIIKWANDIRKTAEKSDWSQSHRDDSFSIPRHPNQYNSYAKWFVDGKDAYESIYDALRSAQKEIFIAGWWICPTIHLLRPAALFPHSRLDLVLKKKAEEGVKIYILMYKEVSVALTLNSNIAKRMFRDLHSNIHVLRDPDFLMKQLGMWSHHEKIVSVDQKVAFIGGLDLCFGRWDVGDHPLFDEPGQRTHFVGKDYSNPRVKDFVDLKQPEKDIVDRNTVPRMPWHDCHCRLEGQPARDVARHFIQRWNYSIATRRKNSKLHHLVPMKDFQRTFTKTENSSRLLTRRLQKAVHAVRAMQGLRKASAASTQEASSRRTAKPLSPATSPTKSPISPRSLGNINGESIQQGHHGRGFNLHRQMSKILNHEDDYSDREEAGESNNRDTEDELKAEILAERRGYATSCQILRSISYWSGGCPTERSVQNAYLRLISSANHFIYIENQFFVSGLEGDPSTTNRIANAIVDRIRRAAANKEVFRVMVIMPLLPAFPGKVDDKDSSSLRGVMYWQYRTICRGENSIYHTLFKELEDPFEYLAFYGLRTHNVNNGSPETEEIYVHSKVMIVDDRSCIIGSANINERSMNGDRDSEIAVLVDDTEMEESIRIANGTFSVGKFAHSFRMKLFEEHFGLIPGSGLYKKYSDPVNSDAWFSMQEQAMKNCQIYESVFGCLPSDNVLTFKQIDMHIENAAVSSKRDSQQHNSTRRSHRRTRADSASTAARNTAGSPSQDTSLIQSPTGSPKRKPTTIVEQEMPIQDDQIETQIDSLWNLQGQGPQSNRPKSPASSNREPSENAEAVGIPTDDEAIHVGDRQRSGLLHLNMREGSQILTRREELKDVVGHIVYFPLKFLVDETLEPKLFPAELFQ